jgi:ribosomal-protein-alanine N-acetyltransferase
MTFLVDITEKNFSRLRGAVLEIERSSFPSPWTVAAFLEEVKRPISHLWALISHHGLTGYACFWMFAREIHLMNLAVHPKRRGQGHGRHLLDKMIEAGVSRGVETVWLEVRPSNIPARALYETAGFREIGRRARYYRDTNEDAIVMSLSLSPARTGEERGVPFIRNGNEEVKDVAKSGY